MFYSRFRWRQYESNAVEKRKYDISAHKCIYVVFAPNDCGYNDTFYSKMFKDKCPARNTTVQLLTPYTDLAAPQCTVL